MRRMPALGLALLALVAAGFLWTRDRPVAVAGEMPMPLAAAEDADADAPLVARRSNVTPADREARRFLPVMTRTRTPASAATSI